jgi:hypothetical protein
MKTNHRILLDPAPAPAGGGTPPTATPPPPAPAPAAPPAATPPPELAKPPLPPAPEPPKSASEDPLIRSILKDMGAVVKEPEIKPVPDAPPPAPAPAPAPAAPPVKKSFKKKDAPPPAPAPAAPPEPPAAPKPEPPPPAPPAEDDKEYIATLPEEAQDDIQVLQFAAKSDKKYAEHAKKLVQFHKDLDAQVKAGKDEDDIKEFIEKNRPKLGVVEQRKLDRAYTASLAKVEFEREVADPLRKQLVETQTRARAVELKPEMDKQLSEFEAGLIEDIGGEFGAKVKADGFEKAAEEHKMEAEVYTAAKQSALAVATRYQELGNGLRAYNAEDALDKWLVTFVNNQCEHFAKNGGEMLQRDGKSFITRDQFAEALRKDPEGTRARHWTFSHADVLRLLRTNSAMEVKNSFVEVEKKAEKLGYKKVNSAKPQNPAPAPEPTPINPPRVASTPALSVIGRPAAPAPAPADANHPGKDVIARLEMTTS